MRKALGQPPNIPREQLVLFRQCCLKSGGCRSPSDRLSCRSYSQCFVLERRGWPCNVSFGTIGDGPGFFPGVSMVVYQLKLVSDGSSCGTPRSIVIPGSRRRRLTAHADKAKPMQPAGAMIAIAWINVIMAHPFVCRVLRCRCAHPTARTFPFSPTAATNEFRKELSSFRNCLQRFFRVPSTSQ